MDDEDSSDVSVVWECLVEKMSKKWLHDVFATDVGHCKRWKAPPYPLKHWYYPYSERNEIRFGGGVKDGDGA